MSWEDLLITILTSSIGAGGSIFVIYKMYYQNILNKNLAEYKNELVKETEKVKTTLNIFSKKQELIINSKFDLYNNLWGSLIDLKVTMDYLWIKLDKPTFNNFVNNLKNARISINKNKLLLDKDDYTGLIEIIDTIEKYKNGKK